MVLALEAGRFFCFLIGVVAALVKLIEMREDSER